MIEMNNLLFKIKLSDDEKKRVKIIFKESSCNKKTKNLKLKANKTMEIYRTKKAENKGIQYLVTDFLKELKMETKDIMEVLDKDEYVFFQPSDLTDRNFVSSTFYKISQFFVRNVEIKLSSFELEKYKLGSLKEIIEKKIKFDNVYTPLSKDQMHEVFIKSHDILFQKQLHIINFHQALLTIYYLYDFLNIGGNLITWIYLSRYDVCEKENIIKLLSLLFESVIIYRNDYFLCHNFQGDKFISKNKIHELLSRDFVIENNDIFKKYMLYIDNLRIRDFTKVQYLINKDEDSFAFINYQNYINSILLQKNKKFNKSILQQIYNYLIKNLLNNKNKLKYNIIKGTYLQKIIKQYKIKSCLQIGVNLGTLSYYIIEELSKIKNKSSNLYMCIDEIEKKKWNNYGLDIIKEFIKKEKIKIELKDNFLNKKYNDVLPDIQKNGYMFDMIFLEDNLNFDTYLYIFNYVNMILEKKGLFIIFNNPVNYDIDKLINFIDFNIKNYKLIKSDNNELIIYQKK